jgi:hypothetical protein
MVDDDPQACPAMLAWLDRYGFKGSARRRKIRAQAPVRSILQPADDDLGAHKQ